MFNTKRIHTQALLSDSNFLAAAHCHHRTLNCPDSDRALEIRLTMDCAVDRWALQNVHHHCHRCCGHKTKRHILWMSWFCRPHPLDVFWFDHKQFWPFRLRYYCPIHRRHSSSLQTLLLHCRVTVLLFVPVFLRLSCDKLSQLFIFFFKYSHTGFCYFVLYKNMPVYKLLV